eukprot:16434536-Heterocapsa_arctica.AAC.1
MPQILSSSEPVLRFLPDSSSGPGLLVFLPDISGSGCGGCGSRTSRMIDEPAEEAAAAADEAMAAQRLRGLVTVGGVGETNGFYAEMATGNK